MDAKELKQSIQTACEQLALETDQARISQTLQLYLDMISKFHQYSWHNQLLIALQSPDATHVAGYQTWNHKFNRQVKRGEKGIAILAPCVYKSQKGEDHDETTDSVPSMLRDTEEKNLQVREIHSFRVVYVFDVLQTEGEPLAECPAWRDHEKDKELESALLRFASRKGIHVEFVDDLGGPEGVSSGGRIRILHTTGTRTLVHELAHELFEHSNPDQRKKLNVQQCEIEADAAAYVVCHHFGFKSESTPNYLALWQVAGKDILACMERVRGIAVEIIQAVEKVSLDGESEEVTWQSTSSQPVSLSMYRAHLTLSGE
jgi:hypothetical protein